MGASARAHTAPSNAQFEAGGILYIHDFSLVPAGLTPGPAFPFSSCSLASLLKLPASPFSPCSLASLIKLPASLLPAGQLKGPVALLQARQRLLVKIAAAIESQEAIIMQANEEDVKVILVFGLAHYCYPVCTHQMMQLVPLVRVAFTKFDLPADGASALPVHAFSLSSLSK